MVLFHPPAFRRRFADEMTLIFDEAASEMSGAAFLADGLTSLLRQWTMNPAVWRILAIGLGGLVPFFCFVFLSRPLRVSLSLVSVFSQPDLFVVALLAPLHLISAIAGGGSAGRYSVHVAGTSLVHTKKPIANARGSE